MINYLLPDITMIIMVIESSSKQKINTFRD
nr:MAG TPA_asm: hypothetical protein [Caudoviricetes sp.]